MDFPVLVALDPTNFDYIKAQPDGADLRFTDPDGTVLPHEIEAWNEGGESFVWVRVPQIEANSDSDFVWMIYGNPDALDRQDPATLWSDYEAVYHLTNLSDSTARLADAIDNGTDAASALAGARLFDSDDYLDLGDDVPLLQSVPEWTISAWIRNTEISTTQSVVSVSIFNGGSATATSRASLQIQSGELRGGARSNETEPQQVADSVAGGLMNDRWHCIAATTHYPPTRFLCSSTACATPVQLWTARKTPPCRSRLPSARSARRTTEWASTSEASSTRCESRRLPDPKHGWRPSVWC